MEAVKRFFGFDSFAVSPTQLNEHVELNAASRLSFAIRYKRSEVSFGRVSHPSLKQEDPRNDP